MPSSRISFMTPKRSGRTVSDHRRAGRVLDRRGHDVAEGLVPEQPVVPFGDPHDVIVLCGVIHSPHLYSSAWEPVVVSFTFGPAPSWWSFGQRVGGRVIHFPVVVCTSSPRTTTSVGRAAS